EQKVAIEKKSEEQKLPDVDKIKVDNKFKTDVSPLSVDEDTTIDLNIGEKHILKSTVKSDKPVQVKWFFNGNEISKFKYKVIGNTSELPIVLSTDNDFGEYKIVFTLGKDFVEQKFNIKLKEKIEKPIEEKKILEDTKTIVDEKKPDEEKVTVEKKPEEQKLPDVDKVQFNDKIKKDVSVLSVDEDKTIVLNIGEKHILKSTAKCDKPVQVKWFFNGKEISKFKYKVIGNTSELPIVLSTNNDFGEYKIVFTSGKDSIEQKFNIKLKERIKKPIEEKKDKQQKETNEEMILEDTKTVVDEKKPDEQKVTVEKKPDDQKLSDKGTIKLDDKVKKDISSLSVDKDKTIVLNIGEKHILKSTAKCDKLVQVKWFFNGKEISKFKYKVIGNTSELPIVLSTDKDIGEYKIVFTLGKDSVEQKFNIKLKEEKEKPDEKEEKIEKKTLEDTKTIVDEKKPDEQKVAIEKIEKKPEEQKLPDVDKMKVDEKIKKDVTLLSVNEDKTIDLNIGEKHILKSSAKCVKPVQVNWFFNGKEISKFKYKVIGNTSELPIVLSTEKDFGEYKIVFTSGKDSVEQKFNIKLKEKMEKPDEKEEKINKKTLEDTKTIVDEKKPDEQKVTIEKKPEEQKLSDVDKMKVDDQIKKDVSLLSVDEDKTIDLNIGEKHILKSFAKCDKPVQVNWFFNGKEISKFKYKVIGNTSELPIV
uniref:Ig-like domain-containing protein n=1 Tax=Strongyloides stercoralis TaxID=6248 RepID=A0A0K0EPF6_STRER